MVAAAVLGPLSACSGYPKDEPAPWALRHADAASDTVDVIVGFGGCSEFRRVEIDEREDTVRLTAIVHTTGTDCPAVFDVQEATVVLQSPLGARELLGACTTEDECPAGFEA